jgi:hypothetical protein
VSHEKTAILGQPTGLAFTLERIGPKAAGDICQHSAPVSFTIHIPGSMPHNAQRSDCPFEVPMRGLTRLAHCCNDRTGIMISQPLAGTAILKPIPGSPRVQ